MAKKIIEEIEKTPETSKKPCDNCGEMGVKQGFRKLLDPWLVSGCRSVKFVKPAGAGLGVVNFTSACRKCNGTGKIAG